MKKLLLSLSLLSISQMYPQAAGSLDTSFGTGGKVITTINNDERANALIIQPDGKIVVAGYTYSATYGNDMACLRYNTDGSPDTTFGTNGVATFDLQLGSDDKAMAIEIQSDGKLILAGYSDSGSNKDGAVIRLNTDGTLDTTFGTAGKVLTNYSTTGMATRQDEYWVVKVHGLTGNIVVGGTSYSASNNSRGIVARYTSAGELDTTFANGGKYTALPDSQISSSYLFSIEDLAIKPNGKITVVGWSTAWFYLGRLNANGTMDTTFSSDGFNHLWGGAMYSVVLNNDDSFYFTGDIWTSPQTEVYTGYIDGDGSGLVAEHFNFGATMTATTLALAKDSNGKLVVAGYLMNDNTGNASFLVGRLNANLSADTTFGSGGFTTTTFTNPVSGAFDMKIQADGKIVLAGLTGNKIALARYNNTTTVGTEDFTAKQNITLHPNPANSFIDITSGNDIGNAGYAVFDVNGRQVVSGNLSGNTTRINIESLETGVYIVKIGEGGNNLKFIKE